jgi:hypothetical protein
MTRERRDGEASGWRNEKLYDDFATQRILKGKENLQLEM